MLYLSDTNPHWYFMDDNSKPYDVVVIDDHDLTIKGFKSVIQKIPGYHFSNSYFSAEMFIKDLTSGKKPDIVFMDIYLEGVKGFEATATIKQLAPEIKVIALSMSSDIYNVKKMLDAGASGYLTKGHTLNSLREVFECIHRGEIFLSPEVKLNLNFQGSAMDLDFSERQLLILKLMSEGKSNKMIADRIGISTRSVEEEKSKLCKMLRVETSIQLVAQAYRLKILD